MRPNALHPRIAALLAGHRSPTTRQPRRSALQLDALEGRVVLSQMSVRGRNLPPRFAAMAQLRAARQNPAPVSTTPATTTAVAATTTAATTTTAGTGAQSTDARGPKGPDAALMQDPQLRTHVDQLRKDTRAVLAGSAVTDAQRQALGDALGALRAADATVDPARLATVGDRLLTALADGTSEAGATTLKADFAAAITGTSLDSTLVDTAYEGVLTVARSLNVSTDELIALAADRAAIQADLARLGVDPTDGPGGHGPGGDSNVELILSPGGMGRGRGGPGHGPGGLARGAGTTRVSDPASGSTDPGSGALDPGSFGREDGGLGRRGQPGGPMGRGGRGFGGRRF